MTDLLIHAGQVFTATDTDALLKDAWVRVENDRIAQVSASEPKTNPAVIRLEANTLLPGLVDCHVHFAISGGPDWLSEAREPYATACWRAAKHARDTLHAGFTLVRTLGGRDGADPAMRDAQARGLIEGPRMVAANLVVCMTGGHGAWIGREADGPDDVRKAVREQLKAGADIVKFIATGGVMTPNVEPGAQQLTQAELEAGVEEAHKAGFKTAAHAHGAEGIKAAVLAGIDSIEHGSFMTDESMDLMNERGTCYSVTLCSGEGFFDAPPGVVADWALEKGRRVRAAMHETFKRAYARGVKLVLGTDAGTPFNRHGDNARELEIMVSLGVDPLDALRIGTRNGAELLGKLDQLGTIESGKLADLVLCGSDVVADIGRLRTPETILAVVQGGRIVHRRDVHA
ncbi:MAG: amidohydrolase family protein [Chloroflexi bacterium]|nr:amidohydrolase family protein [Chloroflexota bacterium]MBV9898653.1 amidohydrolase family protein [Chloroflexota bacterium]